MTNAELHLLRHPPTPDTWVCPAKHRGNDPKDVKTCGMVNSGKRDRCTLCASKKPRRPVLLWPAYVRAAVKAGIEPTGKSWWPEKPDPETTEAPVKRGRKRGRTS